MPEMKAGSKHKNTRRGPTRFPRIGAACKALGVSRTHLYYVLTGARRSPRLLRRYQSFAARAANE